jgi:glycosyltransferase involved in cell wall biosynthesis
MTEDAVPRPEVSVVIPVRDGAGFVIDACRSALTQRGVDVEVLVVENGSTDDTVEQVRSVTDSRLRLLHQDPPGVSRARNLGVSQASAEWIAFLDADDRWSPDKLRRQLDAAAGAGADLVFSDAAVVRDDVDVGVGAKLSFHQVNPPPPSAATLLPELLARPNFIPLSSVLVRRARVTAVGGFRTDLTHSEDWDLWVRLALAGCLAAHVPEQLVTYRVNQLGASRDVRAIFRGEERSLLPLLPALDRHGSGDAARRRIRTARGMSVVYGRRAGAPLPERLRDLANLARTRASWRSQLAQLAYTVAPATARRGTRPVS